MSLKLHTHWQPERNTAEDKGKVHPTTGHESPEMYSFYSFFNIGAIRGVVNATPRPLYPRERSRTHCIGGWVGPRTGLNGCGKSRHRRGSNPEPSLFRLSYTGPQRKTAMKFKNASVFYVKPNTDSYTVGTKRNYKPTCYFIAFFFLSNATTCPCGLRGPPSWAWQQCNRLLRLGRPWGAVTLSRWCEWWYRRM